MRIFSILITLMKIALWSGAAGAANSMTAAEIEHSARQFIDAFVVAGENRGRNVEYSLGKLDPRLQLAECEHDLEVEFASEPEKNVRNTLLVSCEGTRPWRLFLNAEIKVFAEAFVAAAPLGRGTRLTEAMLRQERVVINQSRSAVYQELAGLVGMELRRPVREGTMMTPALLNKPEAVARGDAVRIEAKSGAVHIETMGTAMTAGRIGEQIAVENNRSGREIRGVIIAPGHVRVIM